MTTPAPATDTVQSATEWSCDDKRGKCRNPHGCHCREISDLQSELTRAKEAADLTWFWKTVDRCGPVQVNAPSDERAVLDALVSELTLAREREKELVEALKQAKAALAAANLLRQSAPVEELPPSLQVIPNIPHEKQSLKQLRAERDYWQRMVETAPGFPSAKAADDFRRSCEVWIARREEGERPASPPADAAGMRHALEVRISELEEMARAGHGPAGSIAYELRMWANAIPASPTDAAVKALVEAAREFVRKVEAGKARSKQSYGAFKAALHELDNLAQRGVK